MVPAKEGRMKSAWILLCGAFLMLSCTGGNTAIYAPQPAQPRTDIVGTWAWGLPNEPVYTRYEFNADGTFAKRFGSEGGKVDSIAGTYSMHGKDRYKLSWAYDGKPVTVTAVVSGHTLQFEEDKNKPGDPSRWTYRRIK